jgi:hypothetical protein
MRASVISGRSRRMRFTSVLARLLAVVLVLVITAGPRPNTVLAQNDEQRFTDLLAQRDGVDSLAGPLSGDLVQQSGYSSIVAAGVVAENFSASVSFENPATPGSTPWDFGFAFHLDAETTQQVIVDSNGNWYYSPYPAGTQASGFTDTVSNDPSGTNTVDLIVDGQTALLGVNGEFVTTIDLPPATASDVQAGTGFFTNTTEVGRTISYRDFAVWPLASEPGTLVEAQGTPPSNIGQPTVTPEAEASPQTGPNSDAAAFTQLLEIQAQAAPIAGPFAANLKEEQDRVSQSWAGVDVDAFQARATFDVPEATSETPWDVGFMFLTSPNGTVRIAIDSLGNWYYSVGGGGPANRGTIIGLVTDPGGSNTIDLFVVEKRVAFGVNENFVATFDLPADVTSGDVAAASAFYNDQTLIDRVIGFHDFVVLPFDPNAIAPLGGAEAALSPADRDEFASDLADARAAAPAVGPFAGRLVEANSGTVPQAPVGTSLADFGAAVSFMNPDDLETALWDAGFQFRSQGNMAHRVVLRSNGDVYSVLADGTTTVVGTATAYDATPGAKNDVQLFVNGGRALVGVNGELAAVVELPESPVASDILVGASFFQEDFVQGRVTAYDGFSVWNMA